MTWGVGKFALALALLLAAAAGNAKAASLQPVGAGFESPIFVTSDPADADRLFFVERGGSVQLLEHGELKPFLNLGPLVSSAGEGGLLSIALAPDFHVSGRLFVFYTGEEQLPAEIHVAELVASGSSASPSTLRNLLTIPHPDDDSHYGGQLQFGPDGALYISTGDGGGSNDQYENAQDPGSLLGKILRMTPLAGSSTPTVWSLGLRNPFRFSFDRLTGALTIGDVGQGLNEEVDYVGAPSFGAGANFGWNCREGFDPGPADPECATPPLNGFVDPIFDYPNGPDPGDGSAYGCAIIGGYVARGPGLGDLYGRYVYGDLCSGDIRSFNPAAPALTDRSEGLHVGSLNSFGEDSCGRLYVVSGDGPVYRLNGPEAAACPSSSAPPPLASSFVRIRALSRRVLKNRRALISAWVSPCEGRRGDPVTLWRGRRNLGTRKLDRVCSARFWPRISRRSGFRVTVKADETYAAAISRRLTIRPVRRHPSR